MLKVDIPSATSMAELAEQKKQVFETNVLNGVVFGELKQRIETAALEGRTSINIMLLDHEHRQSMKVISKYLIAAGYEYKPVENHFPFNLIPEIRISWDTDRKLERR